MVMLASNIKQNLNGAQVEPQDSVPVKDGAPWMLTLWALLFVSCCDCAAIPYFSKNNPGVLYV